MRWASGPTWCRSSLRVSSRGFHPAVSNRPRRCSSRSAVSFPSSGTTCSSRSWPIAHRRVKTAVRRPEGRPTPCRVGSPLRGSTPPARKVTGSRCASRGSLGDPVLEQLAGHAQQQRHARHLRTCRWCRNTMRVRAPTAARNSRASLASRCLPRHHTQKHHVQQPLCESRLSVHTSDRGIVMSVIGITSIPASAHSLAMADAPTGTCLRIAQVTPRQQVDSAEPGTAPRCRRALERAPSAMAAGRPLVVSDRPCVRAALVRRAGSSLERHGRRSIVTGRRRVRVAPGVELDTPTVLSDQADFL